MNRNHFLGTLDLSITDSLLTNYSVPTKLPDGIKLNNIKQQNDLILIELGSLLSVNECDEILLNINKEKFENLNKQYDIKKRNNSRLIIVDDQFARTLWRRLKFSNRITKLISNPKPLGFNVQGSWEISGVNKAMRLNKYGESEYFTPHKDGQYAPSSDERSLLSLIIYLNDNFEKGETKFYFPKESSKIPIKGLTIKEETDAYGGLDNGYECITIKPKKGYAILFTHNLLHEALPPKFHDSNDIKERIIIRTDVLVTRKEKLLSFTITPEEKDDYYACLNFFREAQQNELKIYKNSQNELIKPIDIGELYERSLSIRYCYPHLLELKLKNLNINFDKEKKLIEKLPSEIWLLIFKYLNKQDIQYLIFAYPDFQLLKIVWESEDLKKFEENSFKEKFIPIINDQYGCQTLFSFSDSNFFYQHIEQCCRVAAVYAFFLLGHEQDSENYIIHYDQNTHEVTEVEMKRILYDVFYNRNCYGCLYKVKQKDNNRRQPLIDFDHSVDRTYMINRHQSQFIGQDLLSRFHLTANEILSSDDEESHLDISSSFIYYQVEHALNDEDKLVDSFRNITNDNDDDQYSSNPNKNHEHETIGYCKYLLEQIEQDHGSSLCRMLSADDLTTYTCFCGVNRPNLSEVSDYIVCYNHLIFDFNTHQLIVERLSDKMIDDLDRSSLLYKCVQTLQKSIPQQNPTLFYRVNISKLAETTKGFHHAGCKCGSPDFNVDQFSFLDYTYLSHVQLVIAQNNDHVFVLAVYGGIAAL